MKAPIQPNQTVFSAIVAVGIAAAFLFFGRDLWLVRGVTVSVGLKSSNPQICQVFWTESEKDSFRPERSRSVVAGPQGVSASFFLPASQINQLRVDFGNGSAPVRAGAVCVSGKSNRLLGWNDFAIRHDIAQFDVDGKGAVDVVAAGGDPYAVFSKVVGMPARTRISFFPSISLLLLAMLFWVPFAGPGGVLWNASPDKGEAVCSKAFLMLTCILVLFRFALSARLPPGFFRSPWDDLWFLNAADSMMKGEWMGPYDQHTLIKGCFGPMVLAASSFLGLPFLAVETLLYILGCVFFTAVCSRFSRNRLFLLVSLSLLLFNPISMAMGTFQRIHRNGMPLWQVPILFGCFLLVFLDARKSLRTLVARAVAAGSALWMFQNTREDGIWVWPFVLVCLALSAVRSWRCGNSRPARIARSGLCLLPIALFLCGNAIVCLVNWKVYGLPVRNDRDAGNYAKVMQDLYLIEPDSADEARLTSPEHKGHYHGIYWSTICKAFEESPTFRKSRKGIEASFDHWAKAAGYHGRDLYEDKPLFGIRQGAALSGFYSTLPASESYWATVHGELSEAFRSGHLRKRGFSPTAMCAPFRAKDIPGVFREWMLAIADAARFHDTAARPCHSEPWWEKMDWNERLHAIPGDRFSTRETVSRERRFIDRANRIGALYTRTMPFVLAAALLAFAVAMVQIVKRRTLRNLDDPSTAAWLFAAGILGSFLLHTACIAYVSATTFWARIGSYMTSSYQMELMFVVVVAALCSVLFPGRKSGLPTSAENAAERSKK